MTKGDGIKYGVTLLAIGFAIAHLLLPGLEIDAVTLILIVVALVPWLAPVFKSLELPGGIKFEFSELERVTQHAKKAGLIKSKPLKKKKVDYAFLVVADQNPSLALAGLRIEIEKRLRLLAQRAKLNGDRASVRQLMYALAQKKMLSPQEQAVLAEMIITLNRAVHGEDYDPRSAQWVIENGPKILESLDQKITARRKLKVLKVKI